MHIVPREIATSRVRLRYKVELQYDVSNPSAFLLNIHAARTRRQRVVEESFVTEPVVPVSFEQDLTTGNRIAAFDAMPGPLRINYSVRVEISHRFDEPAEVNAENPSQLPVETLRFLYPSRYCQADLVQQHAWDVFGRLASGYGQLVAVRDWIREKVRFEVGTSCRSTTAVDTLQAGAGVCRDFAHAMIAYCRALNYPARFVTGVDFGSDPALGPPDFHAYVEVFVGGRWYMFDPTGISPITGLVRIGTGRDAADASFATIFGLVRTGMPRIEIDSDVDPASGVTLPLHTELAVSTAD
jgi:transglutaminase-like putative cysteine protease